MRLLTYGSCKFAPSPLASYPQLAPACSILASSPAATGPEHGRHHGSAHTTPQRIRTGVCVRCSLFGSVCLLASRWILTELVLYLPVSSLLLVPLCTLYCLQHVVLYLLSCHLNCTHLPAEHHLIDLSLRFCLPICTFPCVLLPVPSLTCPLAVTAVRLSLDY